MGTAIDIAGSGAASDYGCQLLADLGFATRQRGAAADPHPAHLWATSGAMALCGHADALPRIATSGLAAAALGVARALAAIGGRPPDDAPALLGERAACFGLSRRGRSSAGGSGRLLPAADGWGALNLAREADIASLPAWLESALDGVGSRTAMGSEAARREALWEAVSRTFHTRPLAHWEQRAAWLGLPFARFDPARPRRPWCVTQVRGPRGPAPRRPPVVIDLSALWAGPLCAEVLAAAGAKVTKVESPHRLDGARGGKARFYDLLNARKRSALLDFGNEAERARLAQWIEHADIVIESTRPRALAQLGIDAQRFVERRAGRVWVSLSGYGRDDPAPGRVAFGDDAAVAAGLADAVADAQGPLFCADAIADPLSGLHAALAAWASWQRGESALLDLSLCDVSAHALQGVEVPAAEVGVEGSPARAQVVVNGVSRPVRAPRARSGAQRARLPGADTDACRLEFEAC